MKFRGNFTRFTAAGAVITLGATLMVGAATSAQAAPVVNYQVINGNSSNSCLQVNMSGSKGNLVLGNCDRSAKQVWRVLDGVFWNPASNTCLDGDGTDVYTGICNAGDFQEWRTTSVNPKSIQHFKTKKWLDANGVVGAQVGFKPTRETASRWVIDPV